jgi:hypothetical protein
MSVYTAVHMWLTLADVYERGTTLLVKGLQALAIHAAGYAVLTQHCVESTAVSAVCL